MSELSQDAIREWVQKEEWPTDTYDLQTLQPSTVLARREAMLRDVVPSWFWEGEAGATILSIGSGKGYFERKYWRQFDKIYVVDPFQRTRASLNYFPIPNAEFLSTSLFPLSYRLRSVPKYAWFGASIHYVFAEFHGWEFMHKLAMMVSDTVVIDAGVFDADAPQGRYLQERWDAVEPYEKYRRSQFSYSHFLQCIEGLWDVVVEGPTTWIDDGRRSVVLKRKLPPVLQKSELGDMELVVKKPDHAIYRTGRGYYKEFPTITPLLVYDTVSKAMGWKDMMLWTVYDGQQFSGLVVKDYGEEIPSSSSISESMFLALLSWSLPLGFIPTDVARENIRMYDDKPVWIDVDFAGLGELDARAALWIVTNTYKQYGRTPGGIKRAIYEAQ